VAAGLPRWFRGDGNSLRQIVLNLVGNAIKFTAAGRVSVSARLVSLHENVCTLQVTVADTGIGIPADRQAAIFSPFEQADASTTRRYGGTGLGLTISRRLVEMMQGRMWLESALHQGSRFHFTVSLEAIEKHQPQSVIHNAPERSASVTSESLNILVAEDNPVNQMLITRLLTKRGHQVTVAGDGNVAVAAFDRGHFDLVLMDIQMPELDGFQATAEIRRRQGNAAERVPIVALTAHAMSGDRERCLAAGMDSYLTKPISPPDLDEMLKMYGKRTAESQGHGGVRKAASA
jgi:CheY-like chemotaxis protein